MSKISIIFFLIFFSETVFGQYDSTSQRFYSVGMDAFVTKGRFYSHVFFLPHVAYNFPKISLSTGLILYPDGLNRSGDNSKSYGPFLTGADFSIRYFPFTRFKRSSWFLEYNFMYNKTWSDFNFIFHSAYYPQINFRRDLTELNNSISIGSSFWISRRLSFNVSIGYGYGKKISRDHESEMTSTNWNDLALVKAGLEYNFVNYFIPKRRINSQ